MTNESNTKALLILLGLVLTSVAIFCAERTFLVAEKRGATISHYDKIPWIRQVNLLVDDFEGMGTDTAALKRERVFQFGSARTSLLALKESDLLSSETALAVTWDSSETYGGWGKGVGENIDLNQKTDYLNFRWLAPASDTDEQLKIMLEEDDNNDGVLEKEQDDAWSAIVTVKSSGRWQLVSVPLKNFSDDNKGGDHVMNIDRKGGLHTVIFSFLQPGKYKKGARWLFDFIFFSSGPIPAQSVNSLN